MAGLISRKRADSIDEYLFIEYVKYPGLHGLCGGHVDNGECPKGALIREFREELGVGISPLNVRCRINADIKGEIIEIWNCDLADFNFRLQKDEIVGIKWLTSQEVVDNPKIFFSAIYNFFKNEINLSN